MPAHRGQQTCEGLCEAQPAKVLKLRRPPASARERAVAASYAHGRHIDGRPPCSPLGRLQLRANRLHVLAEPLFHLLRMHDRTVPSADWVGWHGSCGKAARTRDAAEDIRSGSAAHSPAALRSCQLTANHPWSGNSCDIGLCGEFSASSSRAKASPGGAREQGSARMSGSSSGHSDHR